MDKVKKSFDIIYANLKRFVFLLTPIIIISLVLILFKVNKLYPFSDDSIAWCDVCQQVIPLMNDFKDIIDGKQSITYNFANAGGMSFFGVFFFFLSSPFSILIAFIDKSQMMNFINILVMFKMAMIGLTSSWYFKKKYPNNSVLFNIGLSLLYAFSGFVMMYYQNLIWLDCVYLFPLLLYGIDNILDNKNSIFYIVCLSLTMMINYYIGMIIVLFVLIYFSIQVMLRRNDNNIKSISFKFIVSSLIAAFISMVVLIPSFIDYMKSARGNSIIESIKSSWFITSYETALPLIFGVIVILPFIFSLKLKNYHRASKYIMSILLFIPIIIDPINKMWHFGSYQAFPCRFIFINTFLFLDLASMNINEDNEEKLSWKNLIGLIVSIAGIGIIAWFEKIYLTKKLNDLSKYATSLWGNTTSLEALARYYFIILFASLVIYILYKLKVINKKILGLSIFGFSIIEATFSFKIYMDVPSRSSKSYQDFYEMENMIKDDSFYRVKTNSKIFNVNDLGGVGYNNLGHYTSLTEKNYLFTMKKLGYSSYWMEIGTYGGTSFTDALLLNKYKISGGKNDSAKFHCENYYATENKVFPLGMITKTDLSKEKELLEDTRVNMQEKIYQDLIEDEEKLHTIFNYTSLKGVKDESKNQRTKFSLISGNEKTIYYNIYIKGRQKLYFECFDKYSNSLNEPINKSFRVRCNGYLKSYEYPSQGYNGTLYLGEFNNEHVIVSLELLKNIECASLNVFSVNEEKLENAIVNANHIDLKYNQKRNRFIGRYELDEEQYLFLPINYNDGIRARINNKVVDVDKVFSSFTAIKLKEGNNKIEIYFYQSGLAIGIILNIVGLMLLIGYLYLDIKMKYKVEDNKILKNISFYGIIIAGIVILIVLYIAPIVINIVGQIS